MKLPTSYMAQMGEAGVWLTNYDWLFDQYVTRCRSTREIAAELGCGKKAVSTALKRFGISARMGVRDKAAHSRKSYDNQAVAASFGRLDNQEWLLHNFIELNRSQNEIATELGTSKQAVIRWLRHFSIRHKTDDEKYECSNRRYIEGNGVGKDVGADRCIGMVGWKMSKLSTKKGGLLWCHSSWEVKVVKFLDSDSRVIGFRKDAVRLPYAYEGNRHYYPDFLVDTVGGTVVVEVKADIMMREGKTKAKLATLRDYATKMGYRAVLLSGKSIADIDPEMIFA